MLRIIFIGICASCLIAIFIAALFEFQRMRNGDSVLSRRQSRWRLISAALWMIILGTLGYATAFLWPEQNSSLDAKLHFYRLSLGSMGLMIPALILLVLDVRFTMLAQKFSRLKFEAGVEELARQEIEKAKNAKRDSSNTVENSEEI